MKVQRQRGRMRASIDPEKKEGRGKVKKREGREKKRRGVGRRPSYTSSPEAPHEHDEAKSDRLQPREVGETSG